MGEPTVNEAEARERLVSLFDDGVFTEIDAFAKSANGDVEAVAGFGTVGGAPVYAFSQNVGVNGGAVSVAQCSKIKKIYDLAKKTGCPVVGIYDSNGMSLKEGFEGLSAYGEILKASACVSGVVPQISIVAGSALGTTALVANMADIVVAVKDADFYLTAPSEVTAQDCAEEGTVDIVADDMASAIDSVRNIITMLPSNNLSGAPIFDFEDSAVAVDTGASARDIVFATADSGSVIELKSAYADNAVTAIGSVMGATTGFVAFDGANLCPACAYKAEAFVKFCDAFNIPIVSLVDVPGFLPGTGQEYNGVILHGAKLLYAYGEATVPKVTITLRKSYGGSHIVMSCKQLRGDMNYAWPTAEIAVMGGAGAVEVLYAREAKEQENPAQFLAEKEAEYTKLFANPYNAAKYGYIDDVIEPRNTRFRIIRALQQLQTKKLTNPAKKHGNIPL